VNRRVICTAITEKQRDLLLAGFAKAGWTKRWARKRRPYGDGWYPRREEQREFDIKVRKVQHPATSIYGEGTRWEFSVPSLEQEREAQGLGHYILLDQFAPGMRFRFLSSNGYNIVAGNEGTVVAVYTGNLYVHVDGWEPTPTKADGTPDLYRTPQIGAYWVEPTSAAGPQEGDAQ
jgi:hypothetical protein